MATSSPDQSCVVQLMQDYKGLCFILCITVGKVLEKLPKQYEVDPETVNVTFDDVKGCDEAKEELRNVVDFLKNPSKYTALGAKLPNGCLLVGPPGVGKTLLAKAVAGEYDNRFLSLDHR